jgi:superfamily II DNA or RNA helicase
MLLRDYQINVINQVEAAIAEGARSLLVGLFTGAGKTVIFCELANRITGRTLIIAPLRELVWQAASKVREIVEVDPAIEMSEFRSQEDEWWSPQIVVACKQTLVRGRYKKFADISLVIVDEAHISYSPACLEMLRWFQDRGACVVGFTATPFRMDGEAMVA